jgi:hypothetical protein
MKKTKLVLAFCLASCIGFAQIINTIGGDGYNINGLSPGGFSGDGGQATAAELANPVGVAADKLGNIYFADETNVRIRRITTAGIISTVAGNGTAGYTGDGGPSYCCRIISSCGGFF